MHNIGSTKQTKQDASNQPPASFSVPQQSQLAADQKRQKSKSPSNAMFGSQNPQREKGSESNPSKQANIKQKQQTTQIPLRQNKNNFTKKQGTGGGVLRPGGKQDVNQQSLAIDTTVSFGLNDLIETIVKNKKIDGNQFKKIVANFKMYVKYDTSPFSIEKIAQISDKALNQRKILKLSYLKQIEEKSKLTISLFWSTIIQNICKKIPFLSQQGCLQIVNLQISMNKHIYCQKGNLGNLNVEVYSKSGLFPIINNKIQVNTYHQTYISFEKEVLHLILNLFKGQSMIFRQMNELKINNNEKYQNVFSILKDNSDKKKEILNNLFASFFIMLKLTPQEKFLSNIEYFQYVCESIWSFYNCQEPYFEINNCKQFLSKLIENYSLFNQSGKRKSVNFKQFINCVQKIVISILLKSPFNFNNWEKEKLKNIIFDSSLEMLEPFRMILPQNKRQGRRLRVYYYETKRYHWKEFIEILIKLGENDDQTVTFIIKCIDSFLGENFTEFWEEPIIFESFYQFTKRLYADKKYNKLDDEEYLNNFFSILGIGSKLMGRDSDAKVAYPEQKILQFALRVHHEFCEYFMNITNKEMLQILRVEVIKLARQRKDNQNDNFDSYDENSLKRQILLKEYLLKLLSSQPNLIFAIFKKQDAKHEELFKYLIFSTITNPKMPSNIIDYAFATLDRMLTDSNTSNLVINLLFLDDFQNQLPFLVNSLFQNQKVLPFVARHCGVLIDLGYEDKKWTTQILSKFNEFSVLHGRTLFDRNFIIAKSYYQLFSEIIYRLSNKYPINTGKLKQYINISFIIDSIKYFLKFDFYRGGYVNIAVCQRNSTKIETLMECIRLFNIILLHELKTNYSFINEKLQNDSKKPSSYQQNQFLTSYEAKQFGIRDQEYFLQVNSLKNQTTSYLNALSFILVSSNYQQKKNLQEVNYDYESLVLQTIQSLAKLNQKSKLKSQFEIKFPYQSNFNQNIQLRQENQNLNNFLLYVENCLNESGIQIIIFGQLIDKPQRLRNLIDKVRIKFESPKIRERMSTKLSFKVLSTLSRYYRNSMTKMALYRENQSTLTNLEIKDHFEYLIQTIVDYIVENKDYNRIWQRKITQNILTNIYGGFLKVQTFDSSHFLKLLKTFHPIILHSINLSYLNNPSCIKHVQTNAFERSKYEIDSLNAVSEEYFKLLVIFFSCQQYLSEEEFKIITGIKQLSQKVSEFILSMTKYSQFQKLSQNFREILFQILLSSVSFFVSISNNQQQKNSLLSEIYDIINEQKNRVQPSISFTLLQIFILQQLNLCYSHNELLLSNQKIFPLQLISVDRELPSHILQQMVLRLKKIDLNDMTFVTISTGLFTNIQESGDLSHLLNPLLHAYEQLLRFSQLYQQQTAQSSFISKSAQPQRNKQVNWSNNKSPYKKVWMVQLILAILTDIQTNSSSNKIQNQKQFQNILIQNDAILTRFGTLMIKIGLQESQTYLPWISYLQEQIADQLTIDKAISFAQKLELYQILKIFSFVFANTAWKQTFLKKHIQLVKILVQYRKVFQKLSFSNRKSKSLSTQQKILQGISLNNFLSVQDQFKSGLKQFDKERVSGEVLKSSNCYDLLHEIINFQLSVQYSLICVSISVPFCDALCRKQSEIADISKWNTLLLEYAQILVQKYIQLLTHAPTLQKILNDFSLIYSGNSVFSINLSKQMLFTNSPSLSSYLDFSHDSWKKLLIEVLTLIFEKIAFINKKLQVQIHSDFKTHQQRFVSLIHSLKKHDKQNFDFTLYDPMEFKSRMNQTIRSNLSRSFMDTQRNPLSESIRNY